MLADLRRPRLAGKIDPVFLNQVRRLLALAEQVNITERIRVSRDPEDDMFLELAVNGQADAIVSGDADLLALDTFREIPIITPAAFGAVAP